MSQNKEVHYLERMEFYITHVCNLNCERCNRFNNYAFAGHKKWADYREDYVKWSKILYPSFINILGGEPLLHPEFMTWLTGVSELWPNSRIVIITNGTQFDRWPDLYSVMKKEEGRIQIDLSVHDRSSMKTHEKWIYNFLEGPITREVVRYSDPGPWRENYEIIRDPSWPDCPTPNDFKSLPEFIQKECREIHGFSDETFAEIHGLKVLYTDANGVRIRLLKGYEFTLPSLMPNQETQSFDFWSSDPKKALDACHIKTCHHMIDGKLYKCGPVALWKEFAEQYKVNMDPMQEKLVYSYEPASHDWDTEKMRKFIKNLGNREVIPQCHLCPESKSSKAFVASKKKPKMKRLIKIEVDKI